jgi:hypothetical protein
MDPETFTKQGNSEKLINASTPVIRMRSVVSDLFFLIFLASIFTDTAFVCVDDVTQVRLAKNERPKAKEISKQAPATHFVQPMIEITLSVKGISGNPKKIVTKRFRAQRNGTLRHRCGHRTFNGGAD